MFNRSLYLSSKPPEMKYLVFLLMLPVIMGHSQTYPVPGISGFNSILHSVNNNIVLIRSDIKDQLTWIELSPALNEIRRKEINTNTSLPPDYKLIPFRNSILIASSFEGFVRLNTLNENGPAEKEDIVYNTAVLWKDEKPGTNDSIYHTVSSQKNRLLSYSFKSYGNQFQLLGFITNEQLSLEYSFSIKDSFDPAQDRFEIINGELTNHFYLLHIRQNKSKTILKYWRINDREKTTRTGEVSFNQKSLIETRLDETAGLLGITATASGKFPDGEKNGILTAVFNINNDTLISQSQFTFDRSVLQQIRKKSIQQKTAEIINAIHLERAIPSSGDNLHFIAGLLVKREVISKEYDTTKRASGQLRFTNYFPDSLPRTGIGYLRRGGGSNVYDGRREKKNLGFHSLILNLKTSGNNLTGQVTSSYFSPNGLKAVNLNAVTLSKWIREENASADFTYFLKNESIQFGEISYTTDTNTNLKPLLNSREHTVLTTYPSLLLNNILYCFYLNSITGETGLIRLPF